MVEEGFYVHARSDEGKDAKPQKEFLDSDNNFIVLKDFGPRVVYRYSLPD